MSDRKRTRNVAKAQLKSYLGIKASNSDKDQEWICMEVLNKRPGLSKVDRTEIIKRAEYLSAKKNSKITMRDVAVSLVLYDYFMHKGMPTKEQISEMIAGVDEVFDDPGFLRIENM